jgi:hypothetical protein
MKRYGLRDDQRDRIKDLLPGRVETVGVTARVKEQPAAQHNWPFWGETCRPDVD